MSFITFTRKLLTLWAGPLRSEQSTPYPVTQPSALPRAARGLEWVHVPKAQGLKRRFRGPRLCNTEGDRGYDRQTDKQTVRALW